MAIERVAANDYTGAIAALDAVPEVGRDARYHTYRAGVLLNVGRADEAAQAIERALALDPNAADALAQRAVIAVVQNRREQALADAKRAVELDPEFGAGADRAVLRAAGELRSRDGARDLARGGRTRGPRTRWSRLGLPSSSCRLAIAAPHRPRPSGQRRWHQSSPAPRWCWALRR